MQEFLIQLIDRFGYLAVCLLIAVENIFPPIPSEVILTFGGFMTTKTGMTVFGTAFFATIGSVVGGLALYYAGRMAARRAGKRIAGFSMAGLNQDDLSRAEGWFARHGKKTVFFCRMVPILRSLISIPAGMAEMGMGSFLLLTAAGAFLWNIALCGLGAFLGVAWQDALRVLDAYAYFAAALILVGLAVAWVWVSRRRSKGKRGV